MKQTISISDQLKGAFANQEETGEGNVADFIKANPATLEKDPEPTPVEKPKVEKEIKQPVFVKEREQRNIVPPPPPPKGFFENAKVIDEEPVHEPDFVPRPIIKEETPVVEKPKIDFSTDEPVSVNAIEKIVNLFEKYNSFDPKIQNFVKQFVGVGREEQNISVLLYNIINVSEYEKTGLNDLVTLKREERTSRAFSLMSLPLERLKKIKDLVLLFNDNYNSSIDSSDKILYCKDIEKGIESLDPTSLKYLAPINELLSI